VTGGTINFEGPLDIQATATGSRSTLAGKGVHPCSAFCNMRPAPWMLPCYMLVTLVTGS